MKIRCLYDELVPVGDLKPHPKNRNAHPDEQIKRLAQILEYQGFRYPIKVSKVSGFITAGHGRLMAAKSLGMKEVPVNFQEYESEEQEYADIVADNSIASWSELDLAGINADLGDLGPDFDIDLLGLKDFTLDMAEKLEPQCDADEVPEPAPEPKVVRGEVYVLGNHRLMCGDSTAITDVDRLMAGEKADMVFTSPPYNASKGRENNGKLNPTNKYGGHQDNLEDQDFGEFLSAILAIAMVSAREVFINLQLLGTNRKVVLDFVADNYDHLKDILYWVKDNAAPHIQPNVTANFVEWILAFSKDEPDRKFRNIPEQRGQLKNKICGPNAAGNEFAAIHKATFPVYLPEQMIESFSEPGMAVIDFFGGTGTTMIAAEKLNRRCFMMELDPIYCGVILDRWQKFTGKDPVRLNEDGSETPWSEIKAGLNG